MYHYLLPLNKHYDFGFGLTAEAFKNLAEHCDPLIQQRNIEPLHLPINYLYRHAIELYLKSVIIMVQRRLDLPDNCNEAEKYMFIPFKGKFDKIEKAHDVGLLFNYFKQILTDNREKYSPFAKTNWQDIPTGLEADIDQIRSEDFDSTALRYPRTKNTSYDIKKSSMKEMGIDEIFAKVNRRAQSGEEPVTSLLIKDSEGNVVQSFVRDDTVGKELNSILKRTVELLHTMNCGIRYEFAGPSEGI